MPARPLNAPPSPPKLRLVPHPWELPTRVDPATLSHPWELPEGAVPEAVLWQTDAEAQRARIAALEAELATLRSR